MKEIEEGTVIGNYRVGERIGRGGMGIVYRGRHLKLPREVAIKYIRASSNDDLRSQRTRFEREAFVQSQLDHPGIVKVYDYIVEESNYFIVMEFVEGASLAEVLSDLDNTGERMTIRRAHDIFQGILAAVSYAHNFTYEDEEGALHQGIIHRDLKPANILISPEDQPKITDFGIVKLLGGEQIETFSRPYGTPQYVSPEQALGTTLDQRSDIYSLGIILYEMLTGVPPFGGHAEAEGASGIDGVDGAANGAGKGAGAGAGAGNRQRASRRRTEILRAHIEQPPPSPRNANPQVTPELERVVLRALMKRPEERWTSAVEFARALHEAVKPISSGEKEKITAGNLEGGVTSKALGNSNNNNGSSAELSKSESFSTKSDESGESGRVTQSATPAETTNNNKTAALLPDSANLTNVSAEAKSFLTEQAEPRAPTSRLFNPATVLIERPEGSSRANYETQRIGVKNCASCGSVSDANDLECQACGQTLYASPATTNLAQHRNVISSGRRQIFLVSILILIAVACAGLLYQYYFNRASHIVTVKSDEPNSNLNAANANGNLKVGGANTNRETTAENSETARGDLILLKPSIVTTDSNFDGYDATPLTDGIKDVARIRAMRYNKGNWVSAETPDVHWIEFTFDKPTQVTTVYVYWGFDRTRFVPSRLVELQTKDENENEEWRTIARHETTSDDYDRIAFEFSPLVTRRLRIYQPPQSGPRGRPFVLWVREVEAYGTEPNR